MSLTTVSLKLLIGTIDHSDLRGDDRVAGGTDNIAFAEKQISNGDIFFYIHSLRGDEDPSDLSFSPFLSLSIII